MSGLVFWTAVGFDGLEVLFVAIVGSICDEPDVVVGWIVDVEGWGSIVGLSLSIEKVSLRPFLLITKYL